MPAASARRYAQAAFQIALEKDELEKWLDDLTMLADMVADDELLNFLDSPEVPAERKVRAIRGERLQNLVGPLALNLVSLLATRNIVHIIPDIVDQFQDMLDEHRGVERAEVISAVPLTGEQTQNVSDLLKGIVGKDIRLTTRVDPQILGGILARVGDRLIDGSTRTRLHEMRLDIVERVS